MFEMDSFEKELDEQNAALEAMLNELEDGESSESNSLLDKVQTQVDTKCDTIEACESMLTKLNNEIDEFNGALQSMKAAVESFKEDGDKDVLADAIRPASAKIREKYEMITMESVSTEGLVTDDEISTVREFLVGSKNIIDTKMNSIKEAAESFVDIFSDSVDVAMEASGDKIVAAAIKVINAVKSLVDKHVRKLTADGKHEKAQKWSEKSQKLADYAKHIQAKHDFKVAMKAQKYAEKTKADLESESAEMEPATESAYFEAMMDMDMAVEEFMIAQESASLEPENNEDEPAMEGAVGEAVASIALMAVAYAPLIAMAVKAGLTDEAKYVKRLQKEIKPKEKALNKELKAAKRKRNYDEVIAIAKKLIDLNKGIVKEIETLGREVNKVYKKNSDGTSSESFQKAFSLKQNEILDKCKTNIENLNATILLAQKDKKAKSGAMESEVDAAYIEGYTRALEAMSDENSDIDEFLANFAQ